MQSCFNGLTAYKLSPQRLKKIDCAYLLNQNVQEMYTNGNHTDIDLKWLHELKRMIDWSDHLGVMFDTDSGYETNICEHIAFNYCVNYRANLTMSIARDAKLYYYPLAEKKVSDNEWKKKRRRERAAKAVYEPFNIE